METRLRMQRMQHRNAKKTSKWTSSSIALATTTTTQAREDNLSEWIAVVVVVGAAVASLLYHFLHVNFLPNLSQCSNILILTLINYCFFFH